VNISDQSADPVWVAEEHQSLVVYRISYIYIYIWYLDMLTGKPE
jgi:hypothetical protein